MIALHKVVQKFVEKHYIRNRHSEINGCSPSEICWLIHSKTKVLSDGFCFHTNRVAGAKTSARAEATILSILKDLVPMVSTASLESCVRSLSPLFYRMESAENRTLLCQLFVNVGTKVRFLMQWLARGFLDIFASCINCFIWLPSTYHFLLCHLNYEVGLMANVLWI